LRDLLFHKYEKVFVGSYFSRFIRVVAAFFRGPISLLDDGVATLLAQDLMRNAGKPRDVFTFLPIEAIAQQHCVRHNFESLRTKFRVGQKPAIGAYFIGQPLVEKGYVTEDAYHSLLRLVVSQAASDLTYVAHRAECRVALDRIDTIPGIKVLQLETLIELEFLSRAAPPEAIYSCISTALFSLSLLFPESRVHAFPLLSLYGNPRIPHISVIVNALNKAPAIRVTEVDL
jgi:hypothetical protein